MVTWMTTTQVTEIKSHVQNHPEHHAWLANYLVVKRICTQPNFHDLYLELVKQLEVTLRTLLYLLFFVDRFCWESGEWVGGESL